MSTVAESGAVFQKARAEVAKYNNGRTPSDGPPDEVVVVEGWFSKGGREITDPVIIAELERKVAEEAHANKAE